jgi:hypothetical protein
VTAQNTQLGVNIPYTDARLWVGVQDGMDVAQLTQLARTNAEALKTPAAPAPVAAAPDALNPPPPVSTQAAPDSTSTPIETRTEAAEAFKRGEINIDEYKDIGRDKGWYR